jgi:hypothetical protein
MNDFEYANPHEAVPGLSNSLDRPAWVPAGKHARRRRARRFLAYRRSGRIAAAALICAAIGLPVSVATSASATGVQVVASAASGTGASNARSAPAQGGALGTVTAVATSSFTMTTSTGQKVTVDEKSSTKYEKGTASTSAKAVTKGESVLALGTVNSTTIAATQVVVGYKARTLTETAKVVPFTKGTPTASKQVGQIPANWSAGSGTIVSGATANEATEAALAAYPGAVVDRVAKLSNGDYNVHYIGVNWPHHVFESSSFKVVGAL